mgnify:CR=1 FL=1
MNVKDNDTMIVNKILIVDDDKNFLDSIALALESEFSIYTALTSSMAFEILSTQKDIKICLCDYLLGKENGIDFLLKVKQYFPSVIRILFTGNINAESFIDAIEKNIINAVLKKTTPLKKIKEKLRYFIFLWNKQENLEKLKYKLIQINPESYMSQNLNLKDNNIKKDTFRRILIYDSNPKHIELYKETLEKENYLCLYTQNFNDIIKTLDEHDVNVLVYNISFETMKELDMIKDIKNFHPEIEILAIVPNNKEYIKAIISLFQKGEVYRYLIKPFSRKNFLLVIKSAVIFNELKRQL